MLRQWSASPGAAALGGAVYGFSPALVAASTGHYHLQFAVLPPLLIHLLLRLVTGRGRPVRTGAGLGLLAAAQLFISEELLLMTALTGVIIVVTLAVCWPGAVRDRVAAAAAGLAAAAAVLAVTCGYPLWVQFHGPLAEHGSPFPASPFRAHPAAFVTPSGELLLHTQASAAAAASYPARLPEYLAYLGWPLLAVLAVAAILAWRRPPGPGGRGHLRGAGDLLAGRAARLAALALAGPAAGAQRDAAQPVRPAGRRRGRRAARVRAGPGPGHGPRPGLAGLAPAPWWPCWPCCRSSRCRCR